MSATPLVTVVIPTRDRAALLRQTLRSVLRQRDVSLEIVIVDDASSSPAAEVVAGLAGGVVRVLRQPRSSGVSAARNLGVAEARGRWIAFLDDDDLWAPFKLAEQIRALDTSGSSWCFSGAAIFRGAELTTVQAPPSPSDAVARLPWRNIIPGGCSNVIADRDLLGEEPFDTALSALADWDVWVCLASQAAPAVVDRTAVAYRLHGANLSNARAGILTEAERVAAKYASLRDGQQLPMGWLLEWMARRAWSHGERLVAARLYAKAGRPRTALSAGLGPPFHSEFRRRRRSDNIAPDLRADVEAWLRPLLAEGGGANAPG
jgi:glycosyltransferase involved in cell wall biosynthesis